MKIGIVGGTGYMGRGLAIRWAVKHDVLIGSRILERAIKVAEELKETAREFYQAEMRGTVKGFLNMHAARESDVVVITLPPEAAVSSIIELKDYLNPRQTIVSTVVSMIKKKGLFYFTNLPTGDIAGLKGESTAEVINEIVKCAPVVSAFQTVPAASLNNIKSVLELDVLIAGNYEPSIGVVSELVQDIPNLRPIKAGPLKNSKIIESITPMLLNIAILNNLHEPSLRIVSRT